MAERPGLAVVDATVAPRRDNWGFAVPPDFRLSGFYVEDGVFDPVPIQMRDPQTGRTLRLTVIGVLKDGRRSRWSESRPRRRPSSAHFRDGSCRRSTTSRSRRMSILKTPLRGWNRFLARGMEAESIQKVVDDAVAASLTFNRLIQGFMGLGLIVGVAALGVISARAVAERRQQIGVLRAIGFRRGMVQAVFLLESSFIALTSIVVGTGLVSSSPTRSFSTRGRRRAGRTSPWSSLGEPRHHLPRRLPRRAGRDRTCAPSVPDPAG